MFAILSLGWEQLLARFALDLLSSPVFVGLLFAQHHRLGTVVEVGELLQGDTAGPLLG